MDDDGPCDIWILCEKKYIFEIMEASQLAVQELAKNAQLVNDDHKTLTCCN